MFMEKYIHGYSSKESIRLEDQANALDELLHYDTVFGCGERILEVGCGTGAQTKIITVKNPGSYFISVDISGEYLNKAKYMIDSLGIKNVEFQKADIYNLPFKKESFDHVFVCFVFEHLSNCIKGLNEIKRVLKKNGKIMLIEGDHGSTYFYPDSEKAKMAIQCQIDLQKKQGGDANIGRKLYPLLKNAGFSKVNVSPRMVYVDSSKPELVEGFTKNTFTAMIEGIREKAVFENLINKDDFDKGIEDLYRTAGKDGVFCYTFFKGTGTKL